MYLLDTNLVRNVADFAAMGVPLLNPWQPHSVQEPAGRHGTRG